MTHQFLAKSNYYSFLSGNPKGWQLVMSRSLGVAINDIIEVVETDNDGTPTGNIMYGTVVFDVCNVDFSYLNNLVLVYVSPN